MPQAPRFTPSSLAAWGAVIPQWVGIAGLVFCALVWLITNRLEPALLTGFGALIIAGQGAEAVRSLKPDTDLRDVDRREPGA